jgi:CheY-like chemotaxis protein
MHSTGPGAIQPLAPGTDQLVMFNPREHVVLIADDDPDVRMLVTTILERQGYGVIEACDGQEAVEMIRGQSPALALLDVNMPRLDGVQVAEQLRADDSPTPFIFVTALTRRAALDRIVATNPAGYIAKPFPTEKLREQVRAALSSAA